MSYKYYNSGSPTFFKNTKDQLINGFQANLTVNFANSSTYQTIQEESSFFSGSMININVRVNRAINSITGEKLGDDWKNILFEDITHTTGLGWKYYFDSNYFIVVFSETIKNLAASVTVRRCNNQLRWVDNNGISYAEPCIIESSLNRPTDSDTGNNPVLGEGFIRIYSQLNTNSKYIKTGQRFLFGSEVNRVAYMVYGQGVRNFLNQETMDDDSGNLLQLIMGTSQINVETDDIVNGIADFNKVIYLITTNISGSISGSPGMGIQVSPIITRNLIPVNENISYTTSASPVVIVSGSGLVTLVSTGSAIITVSMTDNISVHTHIPVVVTSGSVTEYEIRVTPDTGYILQEETESYSVFLYLNGTIQTDIFDFSIANANVPSANYIFTILGDNSFSVKNEYMFMTYPLLINCISGSQTKQLSILLKGSW